MNVFFLAQETQRGDFLLLLVCICFRVEEAEGVGEPCDTDQLNLNPNCSDSKLLRGLWATAVLLGPKGK